MTRALRYGPQYRQLRFAITSLRLLSTLFLKVPDTQRTSSASRCSEVQGTSSRSIMSENSLVVRLLALINTILDLHPLEHVVPLGEVPYFKSVIQDAKDYTTRETHGQTNPTPKAHEQSGCEPNPALTRTMPSMVAPTSAPNRSARDAMALLAYTQPRKRKRVVREKLPPMASIEPGQRKQAEELLPYEQICWDLSTKEEEPESKRKRPPPGEWGISEIGVGEAKEWDAFLFEHGITMLTLDLDAHFGQPADNTPLASAECRMKQAQSIVIGDNTHEYQCSIRLFAFLSYMLVLWRTKSISDGHVRRLFSQTGLEGDIKYLTGILTTVEKFHQNVIAKLYKDGWPLSQATLVIASGRYLLICKCCTEIL